jgi:hypothetical protein
MNRLQFLFTRITGFTPSSPTNLIFSEYFDAKTVEEKMHLIRYCASDLFGKVTEDEIERVYDAIESSYEKSYRLLGDE